MCICMYIKICIYLCIYVFIHIYIHICICIYMYICRGLPTNINRSEYSFTLEKLHLGTAGNDEALFDPNRPLQQKKG